MLVLLAWAYLQHILAGPARQAARKPADRPAPPAVRQEEAADQPPLPGPAAEKPGQLPDNLDRARGDRPQPRDEPPLQVVSLGSLDPASPYRMAVTLTNRGAAIERVELNDPRYRDLEDRSGYLGNLALVDDPRGGCRVQVVIDGTPAARARIESDPDHPGLRGPVYTQDEAGNVQLARPGDRITALDGTPVADRGELWRRLSKLKPRQRIELGITRVQPDGGETDTKAHLTLVKRPMQVLQPEPAIPSEAHRPDPASFLLTLDRIADLKTRYGQDELDEIPSLHDCHWHVELLEANGMWGPGVAFRRVLSQSDLAQTAVDGPLEIVKRFRLRKRVGQSNEPAEARAYDLDFDIEIRNLGRSEAQLGYQLDGPTGLTKEGWWYSYKVHPTRFVSAGARDVAWRIEGGAHQLYVCSQITRQAEREPENPDTPLTDGEQAVRLRYAGTDAQYFAAVLRADSSGGAASADPEGEAGCWVDTAYARAVGPLDRHLRQTNVSFRIKSRRQTVSAGEAIRQHFTIFAGPKQRDVLAANGLQDFIVYGWFGSVSRPMLVILHGLYRISGGLSFGLAIVLLTVLVRACMFPLGRKMALNAQKMQELAPEMKRIAETYKNDMEKRAQAQRELFQKHGHNPFSGCLVMLIQMPIFLGLYRGLSVDIELRQAPLIPGLWWCSNLAGPDEFWHWADIVPQFISSPYGFLGLGPYLNLFPLFTVALFLVQHKMFTPPPQDEQQRMQHQVMKFMMVFMGLLFFKVASGLCLYLITSTIWGLGERMILPKPRPKESHGGTDAVPTKVAAGKPAGSRNGRGAAAVRKRRRNQRRR